VRILRIYLFLPPLQGGMEKHILRLTEEQRKLGCEVTVAFNRGDATGPSDIHVLRGINLRKVRPQSLRDFLFYGCLILKLVASRKYFNVIHIHGDWSAFLLGRVAANLVRAEKRIASIHGVVRRGVWSSLYRFLFQGYTMVYATGSGDAGYVGSLIKIPVFWQHSGIDADFTMSGGEQERTIDIISVGSFVRVKNLALVLEIAAKMPEQTFLLVGDGPQRAAVEADCRQRGLANVAFTGQLAPAEVARYLRRARIFLSTSFAEGTPTAFLEAMACGLAVVTSCSNNYDELLRPGRNGYVIEGFEVYDYVAKIRELLDDSRLLDGISRHNSAQAQSYSWPAVAKRITEWSRLVQTQPEYVSSESTTVLQLVTGLGVGGAERVVMELAGRLPGEGVRSVVVALKDDRSLLAQYNNADFPIYSLRMTRNPWSFIKATVALIRIIRHERVSLIHAHMFHALSLALASRIVLPDCKVIFTSHSSKGFSRLRWLLIRVSKPLRAADVVFIEGQHPEMSASDTFVIPNGVPVDPGRADIEKTRKERRIFLFVGRLEQAKNPVGLIRSFAAMRHKDCELWLAGDGYLRPEVEREITIAGLEDRVHLLGVRQDVPQLLEQADCFVMASHWEGLPMAILEAGAVALPVVAPPVGAIPLLLSEGCGYLVEAADLHDALDAVLDDYEEAGRRGKRLRDKVLNGYSLEHMSKAHAELYARL